MKTGQRVLITGAGSGVGTFAVQLAKWLGASVTAVTNPRSVDAVRALDPDLVIDYSTDDFTRRPERYDVVLDISGKDPIGRCTKVLVPGGVFVVVGIHGGLGRLVKAALLRGILRYPLRSFVAKVTPEDLRVLGDLVAEGRLRPVIDRAYSFEDVPKAMGYAADHQAVGKLVIDVAGSRGS